MLNGRSNLKRTIITAYVRHNNDKFNYVEGMPLPPLEAMACGCAVVVTDNGGINEYIKDGVNGLICPIRDSDCLALKLDIYSKMIKQGLILLKMVLLPRRNILWIICLAIL